ncbi:MAG: TIGR02996 domain-containing protein [Planctomycetales bacterium]
MERAFKQEIATNPADEAPRLVFADWLEERGDDERAAYWRGFDASQLYTLIVENYYNPNDYEGDPDDGDGSGNGSVPGYDDGNGNGDGYGCDTGSVAGYGDGYGDGNVNGYGDGDGIGHGDIIGYGDGYGYGFGYGADDGDGHADVPAEFGRLRILGAREPEELPESELDASDE